MIRSLNPRTGEFTGLARRGRAEMLRAMGRSLEDHRNDLLSCAMHHGRPTRRPLHTSVGATSIRRWLRPISLQDSPDTLLPGRTEGPAERGIAPPPRRRAPARRLTGLLDRPPDYLTPVVGMELS